MPVAVKNRVEQKRVAISSKRQFTIPQKFYTELGFDREAVCIKGKGMLILQPATAVSGDNFAEQILAELVDEGYEGKELLKEFKSRQARIRPAVESMLAKAQEAARGVGEFSTYEDIFGAED